MLQVHFSSAANDVTKDSTERSKYKGVYDVLTSVPFVFNFRVMYDALTELSDLSRMLQKRDTTPQIRVFESMVSTPGPEKSVMNVALHDNQKIVKINVGQFFRSMAQNMKSRTAPTTSFHVSTQKSYRHEGSSTRHLA